jgi:ATP-binding cassette subfamily B protein
MQDSYLRLLWHYLRPQGWKVVLLALLLLSSIGLRLLDPQIVRRFIDGAVAGAAARDLLTLGILYLVVAISNQAITAGALYLGEAVAWTATNQLRLDVARHALSLDLSFHKNKTPGEMVERIDGDIETLSNFFARFAVELASNGILMLGIIALLFREDWRIGLTLSLFVLGALGFLNWLRKVPVPLIAAAREQSALLMGFLGEQLAGTEDVRANGAVPYVMRRFYERVRAWYPIQVKSGLWGFSMWPATEALFAIATLLLFGVGAWLWGKGALTVGAIYLIWSYTERLREPLEQMRTQLQELQRAAASIGRLHGILQTKSRIVDEAGEEAVVVAADAHRRGALPTGPLGVTFDAVSFAYEGDERVITDLSFELAPGQTLGLLGRTGSGKSTLARLLLRFFDVTEGEIRLAGAPIRSVPLRHLRSRVGLVTQEVQLFAATVRQNLTFFDPSIPDERILAVLAELGLSDWLATLPHGLDTELVSGGGLSAGEGQLLALGRLFLADPGLVILDEASSRLDPATEARLEQALTKLLAGRTAIIIAHRLATVQRADRILILEGGRKVEEGEREALAADPDSRFATLLRTGLEEVLA